MIYLRLAKFLAAAGVASRRRAEEMISCGRIKVNGIVISEQGFKLKPGDEVEFQGQVLHLEKHVYLLLNKPSGYISSVKDNHGRPTVMELVKSIKARIYPVGRLDLDTEGLLLLTNDGEFSHLMIHPRHEVTKKYEALVQGQVAGDDLRQLQQGIILDDGLTAPAKVRVLKQNEDHTLLELEIHEGRKRQVKRMCEAIGHKVVHLRRTSFAFLNLEGVPSGKYRELTAAEVGKLKESAQKFSH
ncbi:MAG: pseudouridine synthase [Syntrophomonas sp.]